MYGSAPVNQERQDLERVARLWASKYSFQGHVGPEQLHDDQADHDLEKNIKESRNRHTSRGIMTNVIVISRCC